MQNSITGTYVNLQSFMVTNLGLKGNNLFVYAIIYGFSKNHNGQYFGGVKFIQNWLSISERCARKCLKSLQAQGLIVSIPVTKNGHLHHNYVATNINQTNY